jgi:uncharacterized protein (DUF1499 family)
MDTDKDGSNYLPRYEIDRHIRANSIACRHQNLCCLSYAWYATTSPITEAGKVIAELKVVVGSMKGVTIVSESAAYLHVEFQSNIFRFIDDVEFVVDDAAKVVHVRSASRVGYYDLGVNRRRVEKIRQAWNQKKAHNK